MGYDTYHWGELELSKNPDENVKKHFTGRVNLGYRPDDLVDESGLWFLVYSEDSKGASRCCLERAECTRHSDPEEGLQELINKVFAPNGIVLDGSIEWQGDSSDDKGLVVVKENKINKYFGHTIYVDSDKNVINDDVEFLGKLGFFKKSNHIENNYLETEVK